jgi:hypothetical protein
MIWIEGKKNGLGVLTKRNGDHFEGQLLNNKRKGQESNFFLELRINFLLEIGLMIYLKLEFT